MAKLESTIGVRPFMRLVGPLDMQYRNHDVLCSCPSNLCVWGWGGGGGGGGEEGSGGEGGRRGVGGGGGGDIGLTIHSSCCVMASFNSKLRDLLGMKSTPRFLANPVLL